MSKHDKAYIEKFQSTGLDVTVSKTSRGDQDYMQIMSKDMTINIVLIADRISVFDIRRVEQEQGEAPDE